jgi:hypothetical protein
LYQITILFEGFWSGGTFDKLAFLHSYLITPSGNCIAGKKAEYSSAFTREGLLYHFPEFSSNETLVREILGMVEYAVEYGYFRKDRDLLWSRQINPNSLTWEQFLRSSGWKGEKISY